MKKNLFIEFWRLKGFVFLNLLLLTFCLSCQKKDDKPQSNLLSSSSDLITFKAGRLVFKDFASFMDDQKWLKKNQHNSQLITDKNESLGLKSMTEYYLEGMKLEEIDPKFAEYVAKYPSVFSKETYDNSTLYLLPHSKILCYVANKDGIFQIGDQIYRIAQNYIYQTDESKIEMLFLPKDQISTKDVKISLSQPRLAAKNDYGNIPVPFTNNSSFRIVSTLREYTIEDVNTGITFWYDDIITNPQKRTLFTWIRAQLNTKSANDNGYINVLDCPSCTQQPIYAQYDENTGLSQDVIYVGSDYQLDMSASYCPAYSRGRLIVNNNPQYIYINWEDALAYPATCAWTRTDVLNDPF